MWKEFSYVTQTGQACCILGTWSSFQNVRHTQSPSGVTCFHFIILSANGAGWGAVAPQRTSDNPSR